MKLKLFLILIVFCLIPSSSRAAGKEWNQLKGQDFIIYYKDVPQDFIEAVLTSAEEEFRNVTENLGLFRYQSWAGDKRASIYVYNDEEDYVKNSQGPGWSHGVALVRAKVIRTYPSAAGFFDSILPHELGHIIFHEIVGFSADVPLWFEEGVAMYQERAKRLGVNKLVKTAIENEQFIPLTTLMNMQLYKDSDKNVVELFYAESASVVYFMVTELGQEHFFKFLRELKENTPFEVALNKVYMRPKSIDDLNKKWMDYLQQ